MGSIIQVTLPISFSNNTFIVCATDLAKSTTGCEPVAIGTINYVPTVSSFYIVSAYNRNSDSNYIGVGY